MTLDLKYALEIAKKAALKAGKEVLKIYNNDSDFEIQNKSDNSPLTKADLKSNEIILNTLKPIFPNHGFLTEEEIDNDERLTKEYVWIIDPIDGTKEFIHKTGEFTIDIGLVDNKTKRPILGVIYIPVKDELFYAAKDLGAFLEKDGKTISCKVSTINKQSEMTLTKSARHAKPFLEKFNQKYPFKKIIKLGSSIKGCAVANGTADLYIRTTEFSEWDCCSMEILVQEAGGTTTLLNGKPRIYNQKDTNVPGMLITNGKIHKELVELIANFKKSLEN